MVVLTLTNCPPSLRGDLTKWLLEINTGVFVGRVSARVRDQLWERVQKSAKNGSATMVFHAKNEQRMDFRIHNSNWVPIDFDGLKLMMRPNVQHLGETLERTGYSKASRYRAARQHMNSGILKLEDDHAGGSEDYVVVDIETTGLLLESDEIIELAALYIRNGEVAAEYSTLIKTKVVIPQAIERLTGITSELLLAEGQPLQDVMETFAKMIKGKRIVAHNASFDIGFINIAFKKYGMEKLTNETIDTFRLAKKKLYKMRHHKLADVADHFGIPFEVSHRALTDCHVTREVYEHLLKLE